MKGRSLVGRVTLAGALAALAAGCGGNARMPMQGDESIWDRGRADMVSVLRQYDIRDERVLDAMARVKRHRFIPEPWRDPVSAYADHPVPIGHNQTISQPFIVAYMTAQMGVQPGERVLEVGTGSGYQAAILDALGAEVWSIEILAPLAEHARRALAEQGCSRVQVLTGDGHKGWPEHAPYDVIVVTCAPAEVPGALVEQLREGGRMILPLGEGVQRLVILRKKDGRATQVDDLPVRFVPMVKGRQGTP